MIRVLSLGAGVQSSTLALMASAGELSPMPDCAIFADTQSEPSSVYRWLDWLVPRLAFPVHRVTAGSLRDEILRAMRGEARMDARPPFFTASGGMLRRQCTQDYKIRPIERKLGELIGHRPRSRWPRVPVVEQWIGISLDEVQRARPSRNAWAVHRWPLIERGLTRADCLAWLDARGYPRAPKSACTFCPFHDAAAWRSMRRRDPESFADATLIDAAIRPGVPGPKRPSGDAWFLHRARKPLPEAIGFPVEEEGADDERGFAVECEGMCGV